MALPPPPKHEKPPLGYRPYWLDENIRICNLAEYIKDTDLTNKQWRALAKNAAKEIIARLEMIDALEGGDHNA